jgi:hypothetical protein
VTVGSPLEGAGSPPSRGDGAPAERDHDAPVVVDVLVGVAGVRFMERAGAETR